MSLYISLLIDEISPQWDIAEGSAAESLAACMNRRSGEAASVGGEGGPTGWLQLKDARCGADAFYLRRNGTVHELSFFSLEQ